MNGLAWSTSQTINWARKHTYNIVQRAWANTLSCNRVTSNQNCDRFCNHEQPQTPLTTNTSPTPLPVPPPVPSPPSLSTSRWRLGSSRPGRTWWSWPPRGGPSRSAARSGAGRSRSEMSPVFVRGREWMRMGQPPKYAKSSTPKRWRVVTSEGYPLCDQT